MSVLIVLLHLSAYALVQMTVCLADCNGKPCSLLTPYAQRTPAMHIPYAAYPLHIPSCLLSSQLLHAQSLCFVCRVDAVQLALSSLTSIPPQEQILLLNGNPLDPGKPLGAYQLPMVSKHVALHSPFTFKQQASQLGRESTLCASRLATGTTENILHCTQPSHSKQFA